MILHKHIAARSFLFLLSLSAAGCLKAEHNAKQHKSLVSNHKSFKRGGGIVGTPSTFSRTGTTILGGQTAPIKRKTKLYNNLNPLEYNLQLEIQPGDIYHSNINGLVEIYVQFRGKVKSSFFSNLACVNDMTQAMSCKMIDDRRSAHRIMLDVGEGVVAKETQVEFGSSLDSLKRDRGEQVPIESKELDEDNQYLSLIMDKPLPPGQFGRITIRFSSHYYHDFVRYADRSKPLESYVNFRFLHESADMTFPCFNQPKHRAKFTLSIVADKRMEAYSNMPAVSKKEVASWSLDHNNNKPAYPLMMTTFAQTPPMPVHRLVYTLGHYDEPISLAKTKLAPKIKVVTPNGQPKTGQFALEMAQSTLEWMRLNVGQKLPISEFTIVAAHIRDFNITESLGCALVNLDHLLIDQLESSPEAHMLAAFNVAYVVAQQWFGNLVSAKYWRDQWITDGLAAYLATEMLHELRPELGVGHYVRSHLLTRALFVKCAQALQKSTQTNYEESLEFVRNASIISMLQALVGRVPFYLAIKSILKDATNSAGQLIDQAKLVAALSKATNGQFTESELDNFLNGWLKQSSFPTLSVQREQSDTSNSIQIYQNPVHRLSRIDAPGPMPNSKEVQIPIRVLFSNSQNTRTELVDMRDAFKENPIETGPRWSKQNVPMPKWFDLQDYNSGHWLQLLAQPGVIPFYSVRYMDSANLVGRLKAAIKNRQMDEEGRSSLLNDATGLIQIHPKYVKATNVEQMIGWFHDERDTPVLNSLLLTKRTYANLLSSAAARDEAPPEPMAPLPSSELIFADFGFSAKPRETIFEQFVREAALTDLIEGNHKPTIDAALRAFDQGKPMEAFLRAPIYAAILKEGSDERMWKLMQKLNSASWPEEIDRLREILGQSESDEIREQARLWCKTHACS